MLALFSVTFPAIGAPTTAPAVTTDPPRESFLLVPLHVHVLSCETEPDLQSTLTDDDVRRIVGKANKIWHRAGVHLLLEPILREPAAHVDEFRQQTRKSAVDLSPRSPYRLLAPDETRALPGLHVYFIHKFEPNGVYLGQRIAFVKDSARLRSVEGGIDEPIPRVTAHELGHAMGLPHRQDTFNLMASGTTGTGLSAAEVAEVRKRVAQLPGAMTVAECQTAIESADADRATLLRAELKSMLDPENAKPR